MKSHLSKIRKKYRNIKRKPTVATKMTDHKVTKTIPVSRYITSKDVYREH